jgi:hypothetical protein
MYFPTIKGKATRVLPLNVLLCHGQPKVGHWDSTGSGVLPIKHEALNSTLSTGEKKKKERKKERKKK